MKIEVIGTGYVGLVSGTCFAEMGHNVTCVDIDEEKIRKLEIGELPIYEPGLESMVLNNVSEGRLHFTTSIKQAAAFADVHFIAVGTPPDEDSKADLRYVLEVASQLGQFMESDYNIVVDKSTVPVGTATKVRQVIDNELSKRKSSIQFDVVSNPEFLKEGAAIDDFMNPDRIIIGADTDKSARIMHDLYAAFMRIHDRIILMRIRDAEMTKYTANAMLATKISFMNEIAELCEKLDVDVENVRRGIGSDSRIGYHFIYPGIGYGGSCFPKDVKALQHMARDANINADILHAVETRNAQQKTRLVDKIMDKFGTNLDGLTFALWGLSFKPETDDMREAPSLVIIEKLISAGATIKAYDPVASKTARVAIPDEYFTTRKISIVANQYDAIEDVDALLLITEWHPFRNPDFELMKSSMKQAIIFDGRNQYDPEQMSGFGIEYTAIGRCTS